MVRITSSFYRLLLAYILLTVPVQSASRDEIMEGQLRAVKEGFAAAERLRESYSQCTYSSHQAQITQDMATVTAAIRQLEGYKEDAQSHQYRDLLPTINPHIRGLDRLLQLYKSMQRRANNMRQDHDAVVSKMEKMAQATPGIESPKCSDASCIRCPTVEVCEECQAGATLTAQGECSTCGNVHPFCLSCNDNNECLACERGLTLSAEGQCRNDEIWPDMMEVNCGDGTLNGLLLVSTSNPANNFHGYGTVCNDGFSFDDAAVACKNLGFTGGTYRKFGTHRGLQYPIAMEDVECPTNATLLSQCTHSEWGSNDCSRLEDVVLLCTYNGDRSPPITDVVTKETITCPPGAE